MTRLCEFNDHVADVLREKGKRVFVLDNGLMWLPDYDVSVRITPGDDEYMFMGMVNRQVYKVGERKYKKPKNGFDLDRTVKRIVEYCDLVKTKDVCFR